MSAYLKEASFAFPVIPAARYVMGALGTTSIPRNLIVKDDKLIFELVGFAQTEQWVESTIAAIDQVASKK